MTGAAGRASSILREAAPWEERMAWTTPVIEEVTCGMEINMYFPAEDDPVLF